MAETKLLRAALALLGVRRFVLAIQDPSFPADPHDDVGRGTPYSGAARRFLAFAARLGFDAVQLGPQGRTTLHNPSPYDGALFSREVMDLSLQPFAEDPSWGGVLPPSRLARIRAATPAASARHAVHRHAFTTMQEVVADLSRAFRAGDSPALRARRAELATFAQRNAEWLEPDARYEALAAGSTVADGWIDTWSFAQYALDEQHRGLRKEAARVGLRLYGDLQVGVSHRDLESRRGLFLADYLMGAPPSRTNPEGQAWGYPVLDPGLYHDAAGGPGPAQRFVAARLDRMLADFDGVRIDHPHGLVTPWVYRADDPDPLHAVRGGARLFASPDLADHPRLAGWSIVEPGQLDRSRPRHDDLWATRLTPEQVARFGVLLDVVLAQARSHGREHEDVVCEVLSTWPLPLRRVMERHGLGRCYVTQKADPSNPRDVYRTELAAPEDWLMIGSHDTATVWSLVREWAGRPRGRDWAAYLASRLVPEEGERAAWAARVGSEPGALADAMLADLLVGPARHVSVFFADLLGLEERYNEPGTVGPHNWTLRAPADFEEAWRQRGARGEALDPARSLAMALRSRAGPEARALADRLG